MKPDELTSLLATLKAAGVKSFHGAPELGSVTVEFFPVAPIASPLTPEKMPLATGEPKCDCGCLLSDHEPAGGTCLHGCDAGKCGVEEEQS